MSEITEISFAEFMEQWEAGLILEVQTTADKMLGKSVKGQAQNPRGFVMVYCMVPAGKVKPAAPTPTEKKSVVSRLAFWRK